MTEKRIAGGATGKTIPKPRDRLQSRLLVATATPVLLWVAWRALAASAGTLYLARAAAVSAFFALAAFRLRAATPGAAVCGAIICFDLTVLTDNTQVGSVFHSGLTPLLLLLVLTHAATRFRRDRKIASHAPEARHGRSAAQVIANLGLAALAALPPHISSPRGTGNPATGTWLVAMLQTPMLAALAEATADTVSSEIGQAIGGRPFLLTSFRRVAPGTDGAVSVAGTLAGCFAAALIVLVGIPALGLRPTDSVWPLVAAIAGVFFDSLLGATLERRGWIGNDLVNFTSTTFAASLCYVCCVGGFRYR